MKWVHRLLPVFLWFFLPIALQGQSAWFTDTLRVSSSFPRDTLSHRLILPHSETVRHGHSELTRSKDYDIEYTTGALRISSALFSANPDTLVSLLATYHALLFQFRAKYVLRTPVVRRDSVGGSRTFIVAAPVQPSSNDFFGEGFQKSGSIVRGFTVGSNRDLSLASGFRMQFSGKLSSEIDILAALTDENSPIQPEGTTQTLQEVDKVFIELRSPTVGATLGDFNLNIDREEGGEFGRITRKVQGAQATGVSRNFFQSGISGRLALTGAVGRGKFHTLRFQGRDGSQGPYRLSGRNGERQIIVIAGSERVFLDGEPMTRGEVNDYTIDYASAEITFSSRRLMTSVSRIVVDFEYSDRQFERNLLNASAFAEMFDGNLSIHTVVTQESDDPDSPLDVSLDDADRTILSTSGSDRLKASVYGATYVGRDSATFAPLGQYVRRDSLIGSTLYPVFIYAPGDTNALHTVIFSPVAAMPADSLGYVRKTLGQFQVAGIGQGNYLPLRLLPVPELKRTANIHAKGSITPDISVQAEFALSQYDQNRLSSIGDESQNGYAHTVGVEFHPKNIMLGSKNAGDLSVAFSERSVDRRFVSADRFNEVEFGRKWNIDDDAKGDEHIREISVGYKPLSTLRFTGSTGWYDLTGTLRSRRSALETLFDDSLLTHLQYRIEDMKTEPAVGGNSSWLRQQGMARRHLGLFAPELHVAAEERLFHGEADDSLLAGSFRFLELTPGVETDEFLHMQGSAHFEVRSEDSAVAGKIRSSFKSVTQRYSWRLRNWEDLSSSLTLTLRKTEFSQTAKSRGNTNADVLLMRSQTRYTPFHRAVETDFYYELSNQRSARLERVFVRVAKGNGNYRYLGDTNGNTIADHQEFEQTRYDGDYVVALIPGETLYPVVDVKTSARIRLTPRRVLNSQASVLSSVLSALSSETYFRIDERSSDPSARSIYLLRLSHFLNEQYTIAGSNLVTQDMYVFENERSFSLRARFNQRKGLVQLVSGSERSYLRERSIRIRTQLVAEMANQTELTRRLDQVGASQSSPRQRDIVSQNLMSDFSYRPEREWEVGFGFQVGSAEDRFGGESVSVDVNAQSLRVVYAFLGKGQLRGEIKREEVVFSKPPSDPVRILPFELTEGRVVGKTFLWSVVMDYRLTNYVQLTIDYRGRTEGNRAPVHLARAEAKAFF